MINSIEKCVAWSVQIAQGSLESAQTTINRAQRLHALIDDWIEGVDEINRHRADLEKKLDGQVDLEEAIREQVRNDALPPPIPTQDLSKSDQTPGAVIPVPQGMSIREFAKLLNDDPDDIKTRLVRHVELIV